jgi:hypothetical protein
MSAVRSVQLDPVRTAYSRDFSGTSQTELWAQLVQVAHEKRDSASALTKLVYRLAIDEAAKTITLSAFKAELSFKVEGETVIATVTNPKGIAPAAAEKRVLEFFDAVPQKLLEAREKAEKPHWGPTT